MAAVLPPQHAMFPSKETMLPSQSHVLPKLAMLELAIVSMMVMLELAEVA